MTTPRIGFSRAERKVSRFIEYGSYRCEEIVDSRRPNMTRESDFFVSYLESELIHAGHSHSRRLNYIDLFCGGGGLSLGIQNSARFLGFDPRLVLAVDSDETVSKLVDHHFRPIIKRTKSVEELITYEVDLSDNLNDFISGPVILDSQIEQLRGKIDLIAGGPPCQGHSNLNNRTRHFDPRNLLYFVMPAFGVALNVPNLIVENVRNISRSKEKVISITKNILTSHGYHVQEEILNARDFGVAQNRARHFLIASKNNVCSLKSTATALKVPQVTFNDVCADLPELVDPYILEEATRLSPTNIERIQYLHENNEYDLPNERRPACHQTDHSYPAVYGRIRGDQPMQTITTGFSSPGRGRYIHPTQRRVLNIREAGRVQGFPDSYWMPAIDLRFKRASFTKIIGDAVPSLLAYPLVATLFGVSK